MQMACECWCLWDRMKAAEKKIPNPNSVRLFIASNVQRQFIHIHSGLSLDWFWSRSPFKFALRSWPYVQLSLCCHFSSIQSHHLSRSGVRSPLSAILLFPSFSFSNLLVAFFSRFTGRQYRRKSRCLVLCLLPFILPKPMSVSSLSAKRLAFGCLANPQSYLLATEPQLLADLLCSCHPFSLLFLPLSISPSVSHFHSLAHSDLNLTRCLPQGTPLRLLLLGNDVIIDSGQYISDSGPPLQGNRNHSPSTLNHLLLYESTTTLCSPEPAPAPRLFKQWTEREWERETRKRRKRRKKRKRRKSSKDVSTFFCQLLASLLIWPKAVVN